MFRFLIRFGAPAAMLVSVVLPFATGLVAQEPPLQRPHIFGIERVQFFSSDLPAAKEFYSHLLGAQLLSGRSGCDHEGAVSDVYNLGGQQNIGVAVTPNPVPSNLLAEITLGTDSIIGMRRYLEFHKIPILSESRPNPCRANSEQLTVVDPEGHRISFWEWPKSTDERHSDLPYTSRMIHAGFVVHDRAARRGRQALPRSARAGGHRAAERGARARGSAGAGRWRARRLPRRPPRDRRLPRRRRAHGIRGGPGGPAEARGCRPAGPRPTPS